MSRIQNLRWERNVRVPDASVVSEIRTAPATVTYGHGRFGQFLLFVGGGNPVSIAGRYVVRESIAPMIFILVFATALLVANRLLKVLPWLFELHLPVGDLAVIFLWLVPSFLVYGLPIASWTGWLIGFGRLGVDGELAALASAGQSPVRQLLPPVAGGLALMLAAVGVSQWGYGQGRTNFYDGLDRLARSAATGTLQAGSVVEIPGDIWLAVAGPGAGENVFLVKDPDVIISVRKTQAAVDAPVLTLDDGIAFSRGATVPVFTTFRSGQADFRQVAGNKRRGGPREMTLVQLWTGSDDPDLATELHQRLALSGSILLAPLAAFFAAPRRRRSGRGSSALVAIVGFALYYGVFTVGKQLAIKGTVPVWLGVWSANLMLSVAVGFVIFRRSTRPGMP